MASTVVLDRHWLPCDHRRRGPSWRVAPVLTIALPVHRDAIAPDGSDVRVLVSCDGASMAHFSLAAGETSVAVAHRTLEEMWYFLSGSGQMWRRSEENGEELTVEVASGVAVWIPRRTHFQFRSTGSEPLVAIGATVPAWPGIGDLSGRGEVYAVDGPWTATVESGTDLT
jgi:mannose-6-phosphate isomerase-like protein (cupin superfamily)